MARATVRSFLIAGGALAGGLLLGGVFGPELLAHAGLTGNAASSAPAESPSPSEAGTSRPPVAAESERKILYYRNPMGLPDISHEPKKDSMGMDYIPVYEDEQTVEGNALKISPDKVQRLGVVSEPAELRDRLTRTIRAVGAVTLDERRMVTVTSKIEGWVEKLYLNTTGQPVRKGEPMIEIYSPDLLLAQEEFLIALQALDAERSLGIDPASPDAARLVEGARQRLRYWDISEDQIEWLQGTRKVQRRLILRAPADGQVMDKRVTQGMKVMPGEALFELADLSTVWVVAEVFEQDLGLIRLRQPVAVSVTAFPAEAFTGTVSFIYPALNPETRTGKIRIEIANPDGRLKQHMYASVALSTTAAEGQIVAVPDSAVLDSGHRQVVLVEKGEGRFEPREVKTGTRADGEVEVLQGLQAGERVVVRANFLIDAESNLQAALRAFTTPQAESVLQGGQAEPPATAPGASATAAPAGSAAN